MNDLLLISHNITLLRRVKMLPTTLLELLRKIRRVARELGKADVRKLPLW